MNILPTILATVFFSVITVITVILPIWVIICGLDLEAPVKKYLQNKILRFLKIDKLGNKND